MTVCLGKGESVCFFAQIAFARCSAAQRKHESVHSLKPVWFWSINKAVISDGKEVFYRRKCVSYVQHFRREEIYDRITTRTVFDMD